MRRQDGAGAPERKRRGRGFERAAAAAAPLVRAAGGARGIAEQRLLTDWPAIAGTEAAAICRPVRLTWRGRGQGLGATLVVAADGARALEVEHMARQIVERVNQVFGHSAVARMKVVQTGAPEAPPPRARPEPPETLDAPRLPDISAITNPELRLALTLLEHNIRRKAEIDSLRRNKPR